MYLYRHRHEVQYLNEVGYYETFGIEAYVNRLISDAFQN